MAHVALLFVAHIAMLFTAPPSKWPQIPPREKKCGESILIQLEARDVNWKNIFFLNRRKEASAHFACPHTAGAH